jgi:hypothetical protein
MEEEEEKRREEVEVVKEGEVDLWIESMQMEKEEDQRGQGRDLWECLGQKMEREVRLRSGLMERERDREFVSVSRVAISMFAIRRTHTSVSCLIFWKKLLSV